MAVSNSVFGVFSSAYPSQDEGNVYHERLATDSWSGASSACSSRPVQRLMEYLDFMGEEVECGHIPTNSFEGSTTGGKIHKQGRQL